MSNHLQCLPVIPSGSVSIRLPSCSHLGLFGERAGYVTYIPIYYSTIQEWKTCHKTLDLGLTLPKLRYIYSYRLPT